MAFFRASAIWFGLFALAFLNGALREIGMKKMLGIGEPLAHQLSCASGIALWTLFAWATWRWLRIKSFSMARAVGLGWFAATVLVETFVLNRGLSWAEVLQTYNIFAGELWGLVVLWIGLIPVVLFALKPGPESVPGETKGLVGRP